MFKTIKNIKHKLSRKKFRTTKQKNRRKFIFKFLFYFSYGALLYSFFLHEIQPLYYSLTASEITLSDYDDQQKIEYCDDLLVSGSTYYMFSDLDNKDFVMKENTLIPELYDKFSFKMLKYVDHIYLVDETYLDEDIHCVGLTAMVEGRKSNIYLSTANNVYLFTMYHEMFHAIYFNNSEYFNEHILEDWNKIDNYVSEYAQTSLAEDISESGAMFLSGKKLDHPKVKLIAKYYNSIK